MTTVPPTWISWSYFTKCLQRELHKSWLMMAAFIGVMHLFSEAVILELKFDSKITDTFHSTGKSCVVKDLVFTFKWLMDRPTKENTLFYSLWPFGRTRRSNSRSCKSGGSQEVGRPQTSYFSYPLSFIIIRRKNKGMLHGLEASDAYICVPFC